MYLTIGDERHRAMMAESLKLLQKNLTGRHPYPVIVFHEGDLKSSDLEDWRKICPTVGLRQIDMTPPAWIDPADHPTWAMPRRFGVGYRSMCRFFAVQIFDLLDGFDWYMRLDDDSFILSPIEEDPFDFLADRGKTYGHRCRTREVPQAVRGLLRFLQTHDPSLAGMKWDYIQIYNNFHIAKLELWRRPKIRDMLEAIDMSGKIYTRRWGDAPIQTLLLKAYQPQNERHEFKNFTYKHNGTWQAQQ